MNKNLMLPLLFILILSISGCESESTVEPEDTENGETELVVDDSEDLPDIELETKEKEEEVETDSEEIDETETDDNEPDEELETKKIAIVSVDILRLRSGPGTDYEILDRLEFNTTLTVTARDNEWLQVITPTGKEGWVHGDYVYEYNVSAQEGSVEKAEKEIETVIDYLGMSKGEIIERYDFPNYIFDHPGGGEEFKYNGTIYIFAGGEGVVNNLYLYRGSEIFGVVVGRNTLNEASKILGEPGGRGYDSHLLQINKDPNYMVYYLSYEEKEKIEVWFFSKEENSPISSASVLWKGYWD